MICCERGMYTKVAQTSMTDYKSEEYWRVWGWAYRAVLESVCGEPFQNNGELGRGLHSEMSKDFWYQ